MGICVDIPGEKSTKDYLWTQYLNSLPLLRSSSPSSNCTKAITYFVTQKETRLRTLNMINMSPISHVFLHAHVHVQHYKQQILLEDIDATTTFQIYSGNRICWDLLDLPHRWTHSKAPICIAKHNSLSLSPMLCMPLPIIHCSTHKAQSYYSRWISQILFISIGTYNLQWYVQLGWPHEQVDSSPVQIILGQKPNHKSL